MKSELEKYFEPFRNNIIGINQKFHNGTEEKRIVYTDWTASGRLYKPIEDKLSHQFGAFVANPHTETSVTGTMMTLAYHKARHIIKDHVNACSDDRIISFGSGMTGVITKFQRILGLRAPEQLSKYIKLESNDKPIVFITHMEHHSNQTSWLETICDLEWIQPTSEGLVDLESLKSLLVKYKDRKVKYASVTACSNVTGITTPYHQIAELMHQNGGYCFVDFACSGPYVKIDMHPENPLQYLDAIFLAPHKFLGGPGTAGVVVFNANLYHNSVPDNPGGGTVKWTNPWKEHHYVDDIEDREDGGTPPFLQTIQTALCIKLKEEMGIENILHREEEILHTLIPKMKAVKGLHLLAGNIEHRLGVLSFNIDGLHYNLGVKLLNDKFGIQSRGGCSCAGTYGHILFEMEQNKSHQITNQIDQGNLVNKPGWIRISIHPTTTDEEVDHIIHALNEISEHHAEWGKDYIHNPHSNEFKHKDDTQKEKQLVEEWFN
ncbi:MAG: aminotransferase class V-fold PLP-dependent enzyme [Brumimicrobium sp.]|nr:aminotransferase class V-fold PLP-dependent enzyme [Brumimicrobium sp.]